MSNIRLTYTGVKYFILQIIAYIIGIIFPIYVARTVPASDFGIYGFIASLWSTFDIFRTMMPFWAGRMIARGGRFIKSSLVSNLLLSIPLSIIYLLIIPYYPTASNNYLYIYLISVLYIPLSYGITGVRSYVKMKRTDKLGYGPLISSLVKISIGFLLVYFLGVFGAIITLLIGYLLVFIYFLNLSLPEFEEKVDFMRIKEWIKGSWYVLALSIASILYDNLAVLVLGFLGETVSLGSYYVAVRVSAWIGLTTSLSIALNPRLLSEVGDERDVERIISLLLLFATPMLIGILVLDKGIIYLFGGAKYMDALIPLAILGFAKYLSVFTTVGTNVVLSFEKFDKYFRIRIRELIGSDMFRVLIYKYSGLIVLGLSIIILYPLYHLIGLALSVLISSITLFILILTLSYRKMGSLHRLFMRLIKYLFSSIVMGGILYFLPSYRSLLVAVDILIGMVIYFLVLYLIDDDFKYLVRRGIDELNRIFINILSED